MLGEPRLCEALPLWPGETLSPRFIGFNKGAKSCFALLRGLRSPELHQGASLSQHRLGFRRADIDRHNVTTPLTTLGQCSRIAALFQQFCHICFALPQRDRAHAS
jgi:hypothetical protein